MFLHKTMPTCLSCDYDKEIDETSGSHAMIFEDAFHYHEMDIWMFFYYQEILRSAYVQTELENEIQNGFFCEIYVIVPFSLIACKFLFLLFLYHISNLDCQEFVPEKNILYNTCFIFEDSLTSARISDLMKPLPVKGFY